MSELPGFRERVADAQSRRRNLLTGDDRKEFDGYYGAQAADGSSGRNDRGAGKGDRRRPTNTLAYDIGYALTNKDLTDDERNELTSLWQQANDL